MHAVVLGFTYSRASHAVKGCRKLMLSDTKVTKEKEGIEYDRHGREIGGTWSEEWTIDACGTNVIVPINFTTKKKGVRYDIQPAKF